MRFILRFISGIEMKIKFFSISLIFISVLFLSCNVSEPDDRYSQSYSNHNIHLFVKNGTPSSDGEFKIINKSRVSIFIPYSQYPVCSFSFYAIQKRNNSDWDNLFYIEGDRKWIIKEGPDTVLAYCDRYVPPLELEPGASIERKISVNSDRGEYRISVSYSFSSSNKPDNTWYTLSTRYLIE